MDETLVAGPPKREDFPYFYALLGGAGRAFIQRTGEFVSIGRHEGNHLVFAFDPIISQIHGLLWYGALDNRPRRALYAIDVSRNGFFLPQQDLAIKDVGRWIADGKLLKTLAESALISVQNAQKGLAQTLPQFWPADHGALPADAQLVYKEAALRRVIERLERPVGIACLDDLAVPDKEIRLMRLRREAGNAEVVRIEPGSLLHKERALRDARP